MIDSKKYTPENPYKHNQQRQDGSRCDYRCDACTWREGQRAQLEAVALEIDLGRRYKAMVHRLSVISYGGSEFYDAPERCGQEIEARLKTQHDIIIKKVLEVRRLEEC